MTERTDPCARPSTQEQTAIVRNGEAVAQSEGPPNTERSDGGVIGVIGTLERECRSRAAKGQVVHPYKKGEVREIDKGLWKSRLTAEVAGADGFEGSKPILLWPPESRLAQSRQAPYTVVRAVNMNKINPNKPEPV